MFLSRYLKRIAELRKCISFLLLYGFQRCDNMLFWWLLWVINCQQKLPALSQFLFILCFLDGSKCPLNLLGTHPVELILLMGEGKDFRFYLTLLQDMLHDGIVTIFFEGELLQNQEAITIPVCFAVQLLPFLFNGGKLQLFGISRDYVE